MTTLNEKVDIAVSALRKIAALDDAEANEQLAHSGSYSLFDEPHSVQAARKALADIGEVLS